MKKSVAAVLFSAMLAFSFAAVASADTVYEAEDAKLGNSEVWIGDSDNASGKKYVGGIDPSDGYARHVEFTVQAPADGAYKVEVSFANGGGDAIVAVIVNGEEQTEVKTPATPGGWANFGSGKATFEVTLKQGENSVKLANKDQYTQIDYIKVLGDTPAATATEAAVPSAMPKTGLGGAGEASSQLIGWIAVAAFVVVSSIAYARRRNQH